MKAHRRDSRPFIAVRQAIAWTQANCCRVNQAKPLSTLNRDALTDAGGRASAGMAFRRSGVRIPPGSDGRRRRPQKGHLPLSPTTKVLRFRATIR